jgi:hypothetical protein
VVYIYGDDELSTKLNATFNDPEIDQIHVNSNSVAIQLQVKSEAGIQFSQIYPVVVVPCIFFIGENGKPLEVSGGYVTPAELAQKFNNAIKIHQDSIGRLPEPNTPPQPAEVSTRTSYSSSENVPTDVTLPVQLPTGSASSVSTEAVSPDKPSSTKQLDETPVASSSAQETLSLEEKKEKALQLLAKKREEKARAEEEKEKLAEVERRKLGQEMARLKQWKEEREKKEFENSYKKQKEEERLARERVRADLERDRQERALKFRQEKVDKELAVMRAKSEKLAAQAQEEARQIAAKRESARIQFRLPDGSSFMQVFPSSELLATCRTVVLQRLGRSYSAVTLSTIYPKRTFSETDMAQTLLDLELAPSAALVVLPLSSSKHGSRSDTDSNSGIVALFLWLMAPLLALWSLLTSFLFGAPAPSPALPSRATDDLRDTAASVSATPRVDNSDNQPSTAGARQRTSGSDGLKRHQDGNIRRFTANDDDDDNATWNGNSTQQM